MRNPRSAAGTDAPRSNVQAQGQCACGAVRLEIDVPAVWAWHDHSAAGRRAHGGAYATYVGSWKSRLRLVDGEASLTRYEDPHTGATRSFCARCGTPMLYERKRSPKMVNIPRGLFATRTGREPRYHLAIDETADWEYAGAALAPLKGYPGVMWERPRRRPTRAPDQGLDADLWETSE
jgi:hypothetical protein